MNWFKNLFKAEAKEEESKELRFRVIPFGSSTRSYVLQYKDNLIWKNVTELYPIDDMHMEDDLYQPILSRDFDELVKKAEKFKADPKSFEEFQQKHIQRYNERRLKKLEQLKQYRSREKYI